MLIKQTCILLTCGSRHSLHSELPISKTPLMLRHSPAQHQTSCHYSKKIDDRRSDCESRNWPEVTSKKPIPTPYEIFNQKKNSPYSKQRFYELVKLYHPDRCKLDSEVAKLSSETRLERYRLVIAANNILGDPVKRSAYDRSGAGWDGKPDVRWGNQNSSSGSSSGRHRSYSWPDGLNQNATWEDWERWYEREGNTQDPIYFSNAAFVGLILTFALLGGIGQATRASSNSFSFLEQRNALHNKVSMELMQIKKESISYNLQEERIHRFMKSRNPTGYNAEELLKNESLKKLLEPSDRCSQGNLEVRSEEYQAKDKSDHQKI